MKTSISGFMGYVDIQFRMVFLRFRWLLPIPVMAFIGYMMIQYLQRHQLPTFLHQSGVPLPVNIWDAFFIAFGNAHYMTFVIANLFLLMVCDILPEPQFGQLSLFRLRSRRTWWTIKALTTLCAAVIYLFLCAIVLIGTSATALPISTEWSSVIKADPFSALIPNFVVDQMSPIQAVTTLLLMDCLGFLSLGLLAQIITMITQKSLYGYFGSLIMLVGGYALCSTLGYDPEWIQLVPVQHNLIMIMFPYPIREIPLVWSFVYWGIWLSILIPVGYVLSNRQDYVAKRD